MSARTLAEIDADIERCQWLRAHMHGLNEVLNQDRTLLRLQAERAELTGQAVAS
jgi:chorismate mutase